MNIPYLSLEEEVADEVYSLIDKHLKPLPKKSDGSIDKEADGFQHNDVDALRHAYASGVFTMEYGETVATFLGWARELFIGNSVEGSGINESRSRNMDLWNNSVGRKYGKKSKTRKELFRHLLKALKNGELIIHLNDTREYPSKADIDSEKMGGRVVVLKENKSGGNVLFLDTKTMMVFSRNEFVAKIKKGEYGDDYEVRMMGGKEIPASKRDGTDNLG